jgi:hypothetical protein
MRILILGNGFFIENFNSIVGFKQEEINKRLRENFKNYFDFCLFDWNFLPNRSKEDNKEDSDFLS